MATVELKEGEKVYSEKEIESLFALVDEYRGTVAEQRVLILQAIKVTDVVSKIIPALGGGGDIDFLSMGKVVSQVKGNKDFMNDFKKLGELILVYKSKNPILT